MNRRALAGLAALALLVVGCASTRAVQVKPLTAAPTCLVSVPSRDLLVGVALSGGGSRAALFGMAGLEALAAIRTPEGASLLERVDFLSSVSGGSIAAAYYAAHKPPRAVPVLAPDGGLSEAYRAFFSQTTSALGQDFERDLIRRQLTSLRWLNPSLAAVSLLEVLKARLFGETTTADVARRQQRGDSPGLIVNMTLYNNGRRLAATNVPGDAFQYNFAADLQRSLERQGRTVPLPPDLARRAELLMPMTPMELGVDPCPAQLAGVVTASASFPPLVGPITFHPGGDVYWHAGDGGLYENQGIESLLFLFLRQLQAQRARRIVIIAFDSSFPFSVGNRRLSRQAQPFSLFTFDFSRVPSIMEERASTYQALFFRSLQLEGVFPDERSARVFLLRHIDAQWRPDLADLPASCRGETPPLATAGAVVERIAEIPTRLRVKSPCDRDLLATAAAKVIAQRRAEIGDFLALGPTASTTSP